MSKTTEALIEQAQRLAPTERLELVDRILGSLDESDSALDSLWAQEAEERLAAYRRGELRAIPLADVLAHYKRA